jgi:hypothetical protein
MLGLKFSKGKGRGGMRTFKERKSGKIEAIRLGLPELLLHGGHFSLPRSNPTKHEFTFFTHICKTS